MTDVTHMAHELSFTEPDPIDFAVAAPPIYRLALVREVTRKDDGAVEMSFGPAPRCERCKHWSRSGSRIADRNIHPCKRIVAPGAPSLGFATSADFGCSLYQPHEPAEILTDGPGPKVGQ